ncbi:Uncharacterized protein Adt_23142 [Abeliophyllum distichum]|uniref:Uncharacterized protein n=1 Tax=Abeliophyllum distichum TaxID=126358 RepID=A0ABD1SA10_9LAMI
MEFLVVDTRSACHGVLGRPTIKDLQAVTSIHHLVAKYEEGTSVVMTIHSESMDVDLEKMNEKMILDEGLGPRIISSDSLASPAEELEAFLVNSLDPTQMLHVGQRLKEKMKEELK